MKGTIFQNPTSKLPKDDPRVVRVPFDKEDLGARKSLMPKNLKNDMGIVHTKGS